MAENNLVLQPQLFVGIDIARNTATCATASRVSRLLVSLSPSPKLQGALLSLKPFY